jgi:GPH family glycoside/pentoside/hexuronide:cation symporter
MKKQERDIHSGSGHFLYSLGAVPSALPYNMIQSYLVFFYTTYAGLDLGLAGWMLIFYGIWNAVNDPLLGYYMDKKKTKSGRRLPYIIWGTIPLTVAFMSLWWVPWTEQAAIFLHGLIMLLVFDFGFTLAMTAWSALYTEMYEDEGERASVVAVKDFIAFVASMVGIILPPLVAGALGWPLVGVLFGMTVPVTMYLSLLGSREREEYQIDEPLPLLASFKEVLKNKAFMNVTVTYALIDFIFGLTMTVLPLYAKFIIKLEDSMVGFSAAGVAVGIIGAILFWRWMYAKKGPKEGLRLAILLFTVAVWPIILASDFLGLVLVAMLPGFGASGMLMTEPAMSAAIDSDEIITGKRREAMFNGILTLVARLSIVFTGGTLIVVKMLTGFDPGASVLTPSAEMGLKILVGVVPVAGGLLTLAVFSKFPLDKVSFDKQQARLKILHDERRERIASKGGEQKYE